MMMFIARFSLKKELELRSIIIMRMMRTVTKAKKNHTGFWVSTSW